MSSATRLLRPYVGLEGFQEILDGARLSIGTESADAERPRLTVSSPSFLHDPAVLVFAGSQEESSALRERALEAAEAIAVPAEDIELVILASTPYLRLVDIVHQATLAHPEAIPTRLKLVGDDEGIRALRTPAAGCDLDICFVLGKKQDPKPLRPRRRGTWLGRVRFHVQTELGELGFTPRFLTAKVREDFGLPDDTIRFVEVNIDALYEQDLREAVELYVDEDLLTHLNQSANTPGARSFQRQLFLDAIAAIVRAAGVDHLDETELADIEGTVLGRIVEAAGGRRVPGESDDDFMLRKEHALVRLKDEPEVFLAMIEASIAPRDDLRNAITGPEE